MYMYLHLYAVNIVHHKLFVGTTKQTIVEGEDHECLGLRRSQSTTREIRV